MAYIASYIIIWWIVFFISLPIAIRETEISDDIVYKKEVTNLRLGLKAIIVTIISIPITYYFVHFFNQFLLSLVM